jgi:hypothetical protein
MSRPTYADYSALIDYLDERATRLDVDPTEGARCYTWAEKLREDLLGLDPTSPLRPMDEEDESDEFEVVEVETERGQNAIDLLDDAYDIIQKHAAGETVWLQRARACLDAP